MAKEPKDVVHYRPWDVPERHCTNCRYVQEHGDLASTCEKVQGAVDAEHVCNLWEKSSS